MHDAQEVLGNKLKKLDTILTILAPTNAAFEALAKTLGKDIKALLKLPVIKKIILYHLLPDFKKIAEIAIGKFITTLLEGEAGIKVGTARPQGGLSSFQSGPSC